MKAVAVSDLTINPVFLIQVEVVRVYAEDELDAGDANRYLS
jgi:hypothetical protein